MTKELWKGSWRVEGKKGIIDVLIMVKATQSWTIFHPEKPFHGSVISQKLFSTVVICIKKNFYDYLQTTYAYSKYLAVLSLNSTLARRSMPQTSKSLIN